MHSDPERDLQLMVPAGRYAATVRFYADSLGLDVCAAGQRPARFRIGDRDLLLVEIKGPLINRDTGLRLQVHGLAACLDALHAQGFIPSLPASLDREAHIEDPAGNRITLVEAPN